MLVCLGVADVLELSAAAPDLRRRPDPSPPAVRRHSISDPSQRSVAARLPSPFVARCRRRAASPRVNVAAYEPATSWLVAACADPSVLGGLQQWSPSSTTVGRPLDAIAVGVIAKVDVLYQRRRSTVSVHVAQSAPRLRVGSLGPSCDEESTVRHVAFWRGCWDGR